MDVDLSTSAEFVISGEQATQESTASKMAEAPAKDAIGSSKAMMVAGASLEGGVSAPRTSTELPKIVYHSLAPSSSTLAPGVASTSPTCGLEVLLRQADILQGNNLS